MPLIISTDDPFSDAAITGAWAYSSVFSFDFASKTGRIVYSVHADKSSSYNGKHPFKQVEIVIGADATPALYGTPPLLSPYVPAVTQTNTLREPGANGPDDPDEFETVVVTAAVDPVYGEAPLLAAAIPGFDELVGANQSAYGLLLAAVDALALTRPEFSEAVVEQT